MTAEQHGLQRALSDASAFAPPRTSRSQEATSSERSAVISPVQRMPPGRNPKPYLRRPDREPPTRTYIGIHVDGLPIRFPGQPRIPANRVHRTKR